MKKYLSLLTIFKSDVYLLIKEKCPFLSIGDLLVFAGIS